MCPEKMQLQKVSLLPLTVSRILTPVIPSDVFIQRISKKNDVAFYYRYYLLSVGALVYYKLKSLSGGKVVDIQIKQERNLNRLIMIIAMSKGISNL